MSNAKRFLSVILAMIMVLSTLVIGASAYDAYKGSAIAGQYNKLDKPVLTTNQYASAAVDELDRMLGKEQIKLEKSDLYGIGELDLTSVDMTMQSVYNFVTGRTFETFKGMLGDLANLNANAFQSVRRSSGDINVLYAVLQFLYDNKGIFVSFVDGSIDLGSILPAVVDLSDYTDVNQLLKKLLYEVVYTTKDENGNKIKPVVPDKVTESVDSMAQTLIDNLVLEKVPSLEGKTNISSGTTYNFIDTALKELFNSILLEALNGSIKNEIKKLCGVEFQMDANGNYIKDENGNKIEANRDNLNGYANYLDIDYVYPAYSFTSASFISQVNNVLGSYVNTLLKPGVYTWVNGDNSKLMDNLVGLAKAVLINTGDDFFPSYVEVADKATVEAMSNEELLVYALRAIINGSVTGMYIPDDVTTLIDFGYYALTQLLATDAPELDFSGYAKNVDTLVIMGVNYAIYSVNSAIDMGLTYVSTMDEVDAQLKVAAQYGINNYGGLLNGLSLSTSDSGWTTLNKIIDGALGLNWLPTAANKDIKTFVFDCLVDNIVNLNLKAVLDMFENSAFPSASDVNKTPKAAILDVVTRIVNIIFPGALSTSATTLDALVTNAALANTVNAIFSDLYNYRVNLMKGALPIVCSVLELTTAQEFKFPTVTCETFIYDKSGSPSFTIKLRNNSTGINTGYTDANGTFHQDALYTYDIKSITSNSSVLALTPDKTQIAAGEEANITVSATGTYSGAAPFIVTITYDVLTEDGSPLTDAPITEYVYSYISAAANSDKDTEISYKSGNYSITGGPAQIYASSIRDIYKAQYTFENASATALTGCTPIATSTKPISADYIAVKADAFDILAKTGDQNGIAKSYVLETTETYDALTTEEERDAVWTAICADGATTRTPGKYVYQIGANFGSTAVKKTVNVFCYDNFGLDSLLESEIGRHRQASNYSTGWDEWVAAMQTAVSTVYSPFVSGNFLTTKAKQYESSYNALLAAVETLDANEIAGGLDATKQIMNSYAPSNEGKTYTDPDFSFFGVDDYEPYTYYNFRDELKDANRMIERAEIPDAEGKVYPPDSLTVTYRNHRLSLYGERLLKKDAVKTHLAYELANAAARGYVASDYTTESWNAYQTALSFANTVNNDASSDLRQTKVNTAYEMLLEYQKRLIPAGAASDTPVYELIADVQTVATADGNVLVGVLGNDAKTVEEYFSTLTNCTVELVENDLGMFTTGAEIVVKDSSGAVVETYIVSVTGDVNGDGNCADGFDMTDMIAVAGSLSDFDIQAKLLASDMNGDDNLDGNDLSNASLVASSLAEIDFVNRTIVIL